MATHLWHQTPSSNGRASSTIDVARDVYDTAAVTYAWSLDDERGSVTNWVYPACIHPAFDALEIKLDDLEAEAGAEWAAEK